MQLPLGLILKVMGKDNKKLKWMMVKQCFKTELEGPALERIDSYISFPTAWTAKDAMSRAEPSTWGKARKSQKKGKGQQVKKRNILSQLHCQHYSLYNSKLQCLRYIVSWHLPPSVVNRKGTGDLNFRNGLPGVLVNAAYHKHWCCRLLVRS